MGFLNEYNSKLRSAEDAVKCVKSGDWIEYTTNCGFPVRCDAALAARRDELSRVKVRGNLISGPMQIIECDPDMEHFVYNSWHCSKYERTLCDAGRAFYEPMSFRNLAWYYENYLTSDVCMVTVSDMDDEGYFFFGSSLGVSKCIADNSRIVIVEVNRNVPRIGGGFGNKIHISEVDYIVQSGDPPLPEMASAPPSEADTKMAQLLLPYIKDGSCIQLGIGGMPNALGRLIADSDLKDLGMHTELCSNGYLAMFKAGKLTNAKKTLHPGKGVLGVAIGTREFYDWLDDNPDYIGCPISYVNDPYVIAQNDNMISINACISADLYGQISSESSGTRQISGTGGQLDFVSGAMMSKGGKSFICMSSTHTDKNGVMHSRIAPAFTGGDIITTPRSLTHYVATEFGVVCLAGLTTWERADTMISIAHPDFRDELIKAAEKNRIWLPSNKR